jgi:hypothetical protein
VHVIVSVSEEVCVITCECMWARDCECVCVWGECMWESVSGSVGVWVRECVEVHVGVSACEYV